MAKPSWLSAVRKAWMSSVGESRFRTSSASQRVVWRSDYQCQERWLLGIIPLTISSVCVKVGDRQLYAVDHHVDEACPSEPDGED